jgi:hypothetical protein
MGDFNLGTYGALYGAFGSLAAHGKRKRAEHDAGEEYYLKLSASDNFKQRLGTRYKRGMTKIDVRKMFDEISAEDKEYINVDQQRLIKNIVAKKKNILEGVDTSQLTQQSVDDIMQHQRDMSGEAMAMLKFRQGQEEFAKKIVEKITFFGLNNPEKLQKAIDDPQDPAHNMLTGLAEFSGYKTEEFLKVGFIADLVNKYAPEQWKQKFNQFIKVDAAFDMKRAVATSRTLEELAKKIISHPDFKGISIKDAKDFAEEGATEFKAPYALPEPTPAPVEPRIGDQGALREPVLPEDTVEEVSTPEGASKVEGIRTASSKAKINKYAAMVDALKLRRGIKTKAA